MSPPTILTVRELQALLAEHSLRLTKRLGQHHLIDARVVARIIERAAIAPDEVVVEIGAGLGALTTAVAQVARQVIAVERDPRIAELLTDRMRPWPQVTVRCQDILEFPWEPSSPITVVGAIPYQITSPILVALCEAHRCIRRAVLIVQEEVAQRMLAHPGTKAYGRLSVLAQYSWTITSLLPVKRSAFFPQPTVDSRCVQLVPRANAVVTAEDEDNFFGIVKAAFSHRRKTLVNCLHGDGWGSREQVSVLLDRMGLSRQIRGEMLSLEQFAALAQRLTRG